ncbi:MAG: phage virion morphogenesis protein [Rhodobacteraceae bacterium]|nr:MAG: phage virion morphogenesis protein [Paracoccaceae bacterium]
MTGVTLTIRLDDVAPRAAMARLAAGAQDKTELMDQIGSVLVNGARERIAKTNVTPEGVPWPKSLRAQLSQGVTLHDSGTLMNSITEEPSADRVEVGSNMIYAGVHQSGATITAKSSGALHFTLANGEQVTVGSVTIPARPYLGISEDEAADIEDLATAFLGDLVSAGGN